MGRSVSCLVSSRADDIDVDSPSNLSSVVADKFILISNYSRIHVNDRYVIPEEVIKLCCKYCDLYAFPPLELQNRNSIYVICDTKEHIFDNVYIATDGYISCNQPTLKITILGDLIMAPYSTIRVDKSIHYGNVIINVFGDINMKSFAVIKTEKYGDIYIKCKSLTMESDAKIITCDEKESEDSSISLIVTDSLIIGGQCKISSGNIGIIGKIIDVQKKVTMNAFRDSINIIASKYLSIESSSLFAEKNISKNKP